MCSRCVSINSQFEHEFPTNLVYPQAILIDDINEDSVSKHIKGQNKPLCSIKVLIRKKKKFVLVRPVLSILKYL